MAAIWNGHTSAVLYVQYFNITDILQGNVASVFCLVQESL